MRREQRDSTLEEVVSQLNTGTLIENRILLMLKDDEIRSIEFDKGRLYYMKTNERDFIPLEDWRFSFEESVRIVEFFFKSIGINHEEDKEGVCDFSDGYIRCEYAISGLTGNERVSLDNSQLNVIVSKNMPDDLPF